MRIPTTLETQGVRGAPPAHGSQLGLDSLRTQQATAARAECCGRRRRAAARPSFLFVPTQGPSSPLYPHWGGQRARACRAKDAMLVCDRVAGGLLAVVVLRELFLRAPRATDDVLK